jgi:O-succinylbenzoate synthase
VSAPVERKVKASSITALVSSAAVTGLGELLGSPLPGWAQTLVTAAVTGALSLLAGWLAKHEPRDAPKPP